MARAGTPPKHAGAPLPLSAVQAQVATALAGLFTMGTIGVGMVLRVTEILLGLGASWTVCYWVASLLVTDPYPGFNPTWLPPNSPALATEREAAAGWLAMYAVRATERLQAAEKEGDLEHAETMETGWFNLQHAAEERRLRAAALVDVTALLLNDRPGVEPSEGPLLGWYSVIDGRTTPECRWANGKNFRADSQPVIGWPGAVHLHCRCLAGPPHALAPAIPAA